MDGMCANAGVQTEAETESSQPPRGELGVLAEIRSLRQEHKQAATENKEGLERLEKSIKDAMIRVTAVEARTVELEERAGQTEDRVAQLEKAVGFLLQSDTKLKAKCNDLEARARRKNIRIHGVPEGLEKNDTVGFVKELINSQLKIQNVLDIDIERAHRIGSASRINVNHAVAPRAIIVRFWNYRVKETDAAAMLREMGIFIEEDDENEKLRKEFMSRSWTVVTSQTEN
ncbi:hypothetical protein WMY93_034381 [Mugilogobius chulae]|uniref:L1 transposable element RRM domain-containing protein n=1 Tax=Mugilogobius chulae TaxID=88201 RepID=A0AAW0MIW3_9GOBI